MLSACACPCSLIYVLWWCSKARSYFCVTKKFQYIKVLNCYYTRSVLVNWWWEWKRKWMAVLVLLSKHCSYIYTQITTEHERNAGNYSFFFSFYQTSSSAHEQSKQITHVHCCVWRHQLLLTDLKCWTQWKWWSPLLTKYTQSSFILPSAYTETESLMSLWRLWSDL